jgi:protein ImuB
VARLKSRPLQLLATPVEIQCIAALTQSGEGVPISFTHEGQRFDVTQASGPERIGGIWWEGRDKTREYFEVEERSGRRVWIFRVARTRRWFLHGLFDC